MQIQVNDSCVGVVGAILDGQIQRQLFQPIIFLISDKVQFHFVIIVALCLLYIFLLSVTTVTYIIGRAWVVASVSCSIQLSYRLTAASETFLTAHYSFNQIGIFCQDGQLLSVLTKFHS